MNPMSSNSSRSDSSSKSSRRAPVEKKVRIKVIGVGGAGVNAVDRLVLEGFDEVSILAVNTDAQALASSVVSDKLQIGSGITHGLGAGGDPQIGRSAAAEDVESLREMLEGYDLIFVAAGMGGGTGTGAGPVIAKLARESGSLVLALVTLPFSYEGNRKMEVAREGFADMQESADAVICIPNDKLLALADERTNVLDAFRPTDEFLSNGVRKIWQMLACTGLINIDFADLRSVLRRRNGETLFGFGEGSGEQKVEQVLEGTLSSPLLNDSDILAKAGSVLISVTHGPDFTKHQLKRLMDQLHQRIGAKAACKMGLVVDENYQDRLTVLVIASTGEPVSEKQRPVSRDKKPADLDKLEDVPKSPVKGAETMKETATDSSDKMPVSTGGRNARKETVRDPRSRVSPRQGTLKLDEATYGLFEKVNHTVVNSEDLDLPTFIRKGIRLSRP